MINVSLFRPQDEIGNYFIIYLGNDLAPSRWQGIIPSYDKKGFRRIKQTCTHFQSMYIGI